VVYDVLGPASDLGEHRPGQAQHDTAVVRVPQREAERRDARVAAFAVERVGGVSELDVLPRAQEERPDELQAGQ
jgi:hypothetical protein